MFTVHSNRAIRHIRRDARPSTSTRRLRSALRAMEALELRVLPGGMLAATSEGVLLASPDALSDIHGETRLANERRGLADDDGSATTFAVTEPGPLPDLPPEEDPLSDVGDPTPMTASSDDDGGGGGGGGDVPIGDGGEGGTAVLSGCNTLYASIARLSDVDEAEASTPGYFRVNVRPYCATPDLPSSVTVSWTLSGTATPSVDYNGPLVSGSVSVPLTLGTGFADVAYSAIDDLIYEQTETVIVTLNDGSDYDRELPWVAQGHVYDDEPVVGIAGVQAGSELGNLPDTGTPIPAMFMVTRSATGPTHDLYPDAVTVYLEAPGGDATEGVDYETAPREVTIPAGEAEKVFSLDVVNDDLIEADEIIELTVAAHASYGFADPANPPKAQANIQDNDVLIILISGRHQNGAENDDDNTTSYQVPSAGAGIRVLREKLIADGAFKGGEIQMHSSDGNDPGNGIVGTEDSAQRVELAIKEAAERARNRPLLIGMAGYSWGGGLITKVLSRIAAPNFVVKLTVYIDAVEHGMWDFEACQGQEDRPALTHRHHNYYQGEDDDLNGDGDTGSAIDWFEACEEGAGGTHVEDANLNVNLDSSGSHTLWPQGFVPPENNRFTHYLHSDPRYDDPAKTPENGWWGIDGYDPLMSAIADEFKTVFGRG